MGSWLLTWSLGTLGLSVALRWLAPRIPRAGFVVVELLPLVLVWAGGVACVWLFSDLVGLASQRTFAPLALASGFVPALAAALAPPRWRARAAGAVLLALAFLVFADAVYFRYFGGVLPLLAGGSVGLVWDVRDSIVELVAARDAWLLTVALAGAALLALWPLAPKERRPPRSANALAWGLSLVALAAGAQPLRVDVEAYLALSRSWKVFDVADNLKFGGLVVSHARDIALAFRERGAASAPSDDERALVKRATAAHDVEAERWRAHESYGVLAGTNVIVVQLEALQELFVGAEVNGAPVMPFLRSLLSRSLYFPRVYDQTGGSPTSDCEYLVLNGLHPLSHGAVSFRRANNDFVALPEVLKGAGYHAVSAHGYRPGMWNRGVVHQRWGFDEMWFERELGKEPKLGWGLADPAFFERVVERLARAPRPFFAFLITLSAHHPYNYIPRSEQRLDTKGVARPLVGYLHSAAYVDAALARLFELLDEQGLASSTTVMLYGDHDAKLKFSAKEAAQSAARMNVDERALAGVGKRGWSVDRVPLLLVPPRGATLQPAIVETVGGQLDVGATLLHYLGVPAPRSFLGLPLLVEREGFAARFDGAAASDRLLLPASSAKGRARCAPLPPETAADPAACEALRARSSTQLEASRVITLSNLAAEISGR